ncbi:MAG: C4-type zinc ribbon domain-containing protein [Bacteroidales bacterium]|jgi:predicted  nucleic acid-binding Zn-ribbon protein|nr:C4-type zinc ribbon domain-containing protein [Bacteroidales bacterium]
MATKSKKTIASKTAVKPVKPLSKEEKNLDIEEKMKALYALQVVDSKIDDVRKMRGELPLEVKDLEADIARLEGRLEKAKTEVSNIKADVSSRKEEITTKTTQINKYKKQLDTVKNNREYDALTKEIEFFGLEIQLHEKRIREAGHALEKKEAAVVDVDNLYKERKKDLAAKKSELSTIVGETEEEEKSLLAQSEKLRKKMSDKWLFTYDRIRKNANNGIAVARIERNACGGCFTILPPQQCIEIRMHRKINFCEYCGRFLVDDEISGQ